MDEDLISCPSLIESDDESDDEVSINIDDPDEDDLCAIELTWPGAMRSPKTIIMTIHEDGHRTVLATSWDDEDTPTLNNNRATEPDVTLDMAEFEDFEVKESTYRHVDNDLQIVGTVHQEECAEGKAFSALERDHH